MDVKSELRKIFKLASVEFDRHLPEVLSGAAIAGLVTTTVLAVKGTPKALERIEQRKRELGVEKLSFKETVKACWKCYIPAAISGVATTGCIVGANVAGNNRSAAIAAAISAEQLLEDRPARKEEREEPSGKETIVREIIITGNGKCLCFEKLSRAEFISSPAAIKNAIAELNQKLYSRTKITVNDYLEELMLPPIERGDDFGWDIDDGLIEPFYESDLQEETDIPCFVIGFYPNRAPKKLD